MVGKVYKNNIFDVIKQIDNKNYSYYQTLDNENQKEIQPYTICRWMSALDGSEARHIKYTQDINNNVNMYFWDLSKYKDLQWKLLCACGQKGFNKHKWLAMSKSSKDKDYNIIRQFYSNLNNREFEEKYQTLTKDDKDRIFEYMGLKDK